MSSWISKLTFFELVFFWSSVASKKENGLTNCALLSPGGSRGLFIIFYISLEGKENKRTRKGTGNLVESIRLRGNLHLLATHTKTGMGGRKNYYENDKMK